MEPRKNTTTAAAPQPAAIPHISSGVSLGERTRSPSPLDFTVPTTQTAPNAATATAAAVRSATLGDDGDDLTAATMALLSPSSYSPQAHTGVATTGVTAKNSTPPLGSDDDKQTAQPVPMVTVSDHIGSAFSGHQPLALPRPVRTLTAMVAAAAGSSQPSENGDDNNSENRIAAREERVATLASIVSTQQDGIAALKQNSKKTSTRRQITAAMRLSSGASGDNDSSTAGDSENEGYHRSYSHTKRAGADANGSGSGGAAWSSTAHHREVAIALDDDTQLGDNEITAYSGHSYQTTTRVVSRGAASGRSGAASSAQSYYDDRDETLSAGDGNGGGGGEGGELDGAESASPSCWARLFSCCLSGYTAVPNRDDADYAPTPTSP